MNVLALIPARSGSKSIPHKNVRVIGGKPLLAHSIRHALEAKLVTRTIVSTDSEAYAEVARTYGAETPFLRPGNISGDHATDLQVFEHALDWLKRHESYQPDLCVHLRPTHPVRNPQDIDRMVEVLRDHQDFDSVRSVVPAPETPFKMWFRDSDDGVLTPVVQTKIREAYNQPRQCLPQTYLQNASIDVVRTTVITEQRSMTGSRIFGYLMRESYDIDTEDDLARAEALMAGNGNPESVSPPRKTFVVDIDGVIATLVPSLQYDEAGPNPEVIRVINFLYQQGHRIILFTARGTLTGQDWADLTRQQLTSWGVMHHELRFGKPAADYYLDDKLLSISDLKALASNWGLDAINGRTS
jgi:CMP-N-acetylneuraminic acid synthetase